MKKSIVYVVGAAVAALGAWFVLGGEGSANAAPSCGGIDSLREPLRSEVRAAIADPKSTPDKLEALARAIEALPPPYACPMAAAEVRQAAKTNVIGPTPPYVPPTPTKPGGLVVGCSPTTEQYIYWPEQATPEQITDAITGDASRVRELVLANNFRGKGADWRYKVSSPVMDMSTGKIVAHKDTYVTFDHYVLPDPTHILAAAIQVDPAGQMGIPFVGGGAGGARTYLTPDAVTNLGLTLVAGYSIRVPLAWNTFLRFDGKTGGGYPEFVVERGVHHPPCVGA